MSHGHIILLLIGMLAIPVITYGQSQNIDSVTYEASDEMAVINPTDVKVSPKPVIKEYDAETRNEESSKTATAIQPHSQKTQIRMAGTSDVSYTSTSVQTTTGVLITPTSFNPGLYEKHDHVFHHTQRVIAEETKALEPVPVVFSTYAYQGTQKVLQKETKALEPVPVVHTTWASFHTDNVLEYSMAKLEQNRIPDSTLEIVYDYTLEHNELVIFSEDTALTKVVVTDETDKPRLNFENLLENDSITYPNDLEMDVVFDGITAELLIENKTMITGPMGWDGVLDLPIFTEIDVADEETGMTRTTLHVGLGEEMLIFDKPVYIVFDGRAGQDVTYRNGQGQPIPIDTTCDANNSNSVASQLAGSGECKIGDSSNLVVWTYHFTDFTVMHTLPETTITPGDPETTTITPDIPEQSVIHESVPIFPSEDTPVIRSGGGGGGGGGSGGGGGGSYGGSSIFDHPDVNLSLYSVSWDCNSETISITAGSNHENLDANVRTSEYGSQTAILTHVEGETFYFESKMSPDESYIGVQLLVQSGRSAITQSESISVKECTGKATFDTLPVVSDNAKNSTGLQDGILSGDDIPMLSDPPLPILVQDPEIHETEPIAETKETPPIAETKETESLLAESKSVDSDKAQTATGDDDDIVCGHGSVKQNGICVVIIQESPGIVEMIQGYLNSLVCNIQNLWQSDVRC